MSLEQLAVPCQEPSTSGFYSLPEQQSLLEPLQVTQLLQRLLVSLDLYQILNTYKQQLQSWLPIKGVQVHFADERLSCGNSHTLHGVKTKSFSLGNCAHQPASLDYQLKGQLDSRQYQLLAQLHQLAKQIITNALEHHLVKQMALKDHLTGLSNRASFDDTLSKHISQSQRSAQSFGLLLIDLDNFKQVNDHQGHAEGDKVLAVVAAILNDSLRNSDYAFRFGGDEFACVLPFADSQVNQHIAERIQQAATDNTYLRSLEVSCSIGSACYQPSDSSQQLFTRADDALYLAKEAGRNCIKAA